MNYLLLYIPVWEEAEAAKTESDRQRWEYTEAHCSAGRFCLHPEACVSRFPTDPVAPPLFTEHC